MGLGVSLIVTLQDGTIWRPDPKKLRRAEGAGHPFHGNQYADMVTEQSFETHPYVLKTPKGEVLAYHTNRREARQDAQTRADKTQSHVDIIRRYGPGHEGSISNIVHPSGTYSSEGRLIGPGDHVAHEGLPHRVKDIVGKMVIVEPLGGRDYVDNYTHTVLPYKLRHLLFDDSQPRDEYGRWAPGDRSDTPGLLTHDQDLAAQSASENYIESILKGLRPATEGYPTLKARDIGVQHMHTVMGRHGFHLGKVEQTKNGLTVRTYTHDSGLKAVVTYGHQPQDGTYGVNAKAWVAGSMKTLAGEDVGHPFHGNQWTDGSFGMKLTDSLPKEALSELGAQGEYAVAARVQGLRAAATRMGFPPEKVKIELYDRRFSRGGQEFKEGGHYNPRSGEITLEAKMLTRIDQADAEGILAHEVAHDDWHLTHEAIDGGIISGELGVEPDDVPSVVQAQDILSEHGEQLAKEDGVSGYSRAYWKEVPKIPDVSPYSDNELKNHWLNNDTGEITKTNPQMNFPPDNYDEKFNTAVNETLAEIRKIDILRAFGRAPGTANAPIDHFDPSPLWRKLHDAIKTGAKEIRVVQEKNRND